MALFLVLSAVAVIVLYHAFRNFRRLAHNIAEAKSSGLPYVVTPWDVYAVLWLATHYLWIPLLKRLPSSWQGLWLEVLDPEWGYRLGHEPFEKIGSDVFLAVSPSVINAYVADAETITQITTRRNDFPKPLHMYGRLDIYGKNLVSTEGPAWRTHRKLTAPAFGEKNNELVFSESLHHANALLKLWTGPNGSGNKTVADPAHDTMRFALYVISRAGFDVRVVWPHEEDEQSAEQTAEAKANKSSLFVGSEIPEGHEMNYREAISSLLENIMWTQMGPPEYLTKSPFKIHRTVGKAVTEWGKFMSEMYELKKDQYLSGQTSSDGMDLFQALIHGSGILSPDSKSELQKSDLLGNAFVIMLAGHETTANALHFSLIFLAMDWQAQRALQTDIDKTMKGKPIAEWDYDEDFPKLFNGMAAAVMNETLRLLQPITNIPKSTAQDRPQQFTMDGKQYTMPGGAHIWLSCAVHRNPKYWPEDTTSKPSISKHKDVNTFRPSRWLLPTQSQSLNLPSTMPQETTSPSDPLLNTSPDTSPHLFKPTKGSYIPFSDGHRSCIGRRFAQVELLAVLAVIFSQYSVELAVDEFASDEEVERMEKGGEERREVYQKVVDRADGLLRTKMASVITLQLRGAEIPIRLVRRGEERFGF